MPLMPQQLIDAAMSAQQGGAPPPGPSGDPAQPDGAPDHIIVPGGGGPDAGAGGGGDESGPIDLLKQMIDLAKQYHDTEPDEEDKAAVMKALVMLQNLLAKDQSDKAGALGNASVQRVLRKA